MKFNQKVAIEAKKANLFVAGAEVKGTLEDLRLVYSVNDKPGTERKEAHYIELKLDVAGVKTVQNIFFTAPTAGKTDKFGKPEVNLNENFQVYWSFERAINKISQSIMGKSFYEYLEDESIEIDLPGDTLEEINKLPAGKVYGKFLEDAKIGLIGKEMTWRCAPKVTFKESLDGTRSITAVSQFPIICYTEAEYESYMTRLALTDAEKAEIERKIPGVWGK